MKKIKQISLDPIKNVNSDNVLPATTCFSFHRHQTIYRTILGKVPLLPA